MRPIENFQITTGSNQRKKTLINLDEDVDTIFAGFNQTSRNNIRRLAKEEDLEFLGPISGNDIHYELHKAFEISQNRLPWVREEILNSKIFEAKKYCGKLIAFVSFVFNEGVMRVTHINSVRTSDETFDFEKIRFHGLLEELFLKQLNLEIRTI